MVGPHPSAAARATPVVVVTKSRRSILLRLVMALPPCVRFHRPFMAGQRRFVGPSPQGVTAATQERGVAAVVGRAASRTGPAGGGRGAERPRRRRSRGDARAAGGVRG